MSPPSLNHPDGLDLPTASGTVNERIEKALEYNYDNDPFLPADVIAELTTKEVILAELSHLRKGDELLWLVDYVLDQATRSTILFLLLARCGKLASLWQLAQDGFRDDDLPVQSTRRSIRSISSNAASCPPRKWPLVDAWGFNDSTCFNSTQWIFMAPVFTMERFHLDVEKKAPLPFMSKTNHGFEGNFSFVYEVEVHQAHQKVVATVSCLHPHWDRAEHAPLQRA